jgi:hypothetical protein
VLSPAMTVVVLAVLWLIVVVPMVLRSNDERRRDRSVDGFGRAMRALGRRPHPDASRSEVFVPSEPKPSLASPTRRAVPAAQEALMYPVDRSEMSEARVAMMTRRRRSLGILGAGTVIFGGLALMMGGIIWLLAIPFVLGFLGYVTFLRSQALRDRERREYRQRRAGSRRPVGFDATTEIARYDEVPDSVVRIDDEDLDLHNMDTVDLTGLYAEEAPAAAAQRRAS